jgi:BirA family biotin operon repressor/biotin-[acetyl-CoA-carboxylase] ligase
MPDIVLPPHEVRELPTRHFGQGALIFPQLDSTNALALSLGADPSRHGLVLLAKEQTAGRGQHGRTWEAPPNSSVLMSVLLFPPPKLRRSAPLVAWAAVSVCELIREVAALDATIKWPNDVLVAGKKVCGILIEQRNTGHVDFPLATVVGLGLNVTQPAEAFAASGLQHAGSLFSMSGQMLDTDMVARRLIGQLDVEYDRLAQGDFAALEARWQALLGVSGRRVVVEGAEQIWHGRLRGMSFVAVELETESGAIVRLAPEEVRHLTPG